MFTCNHGDNAAAIIFQSHNFISNHEQGRSQLWIALVLLWIDVLGAHLAHDTSHTSSEKSKPNSSWDDKKYALSFRKERGTGGKPR